MSSPDTAPGVAGGLPARFGHHPPPLYAARSVSKRFGAQIALQDVDFTVAGGVIMGLVGANGAGKSTLLKLLSGVLAPDQGDLFLDGRALTMRSMLDAWDAGIALVSQELSLFPALTVGENLALVPGRPRSPTGRAGREAARAMLRALGLATDLRTPVRRLSLADRQLVELTRALLQRPRVLILDEPTSALHAAEVQRLHQLLRNLRGSGMSIVYVSHFLQDVVEVSDAVTVLRDGRHVLSLDRPRPDHMDDILAAMLGQRAGAALEHRPKSPRQPCEPRPGLAITGLRGPLGLRVDSLHARRGEVVGMSGLAGAGVEELFAILFGRVTPLSGAVELPSGQAFRGGTAAMVQAGVAFAPADRKRLGLSLDQSVGENVMAVRSLPLGRDGILLDRGRMDAAAQARCRTMSVKFGSTRQRVGALSGGNQQKIVFARWIEADPSLLLLDDPMRGVDVGAKQDLYALIRGLADDGRVVLLYTSDPAEFAAVADRVLVFVDGRIQCELHAGAVTEHGIVAAMNAPAASPIHEGKEP